MSYRCVIVDDEVLARDLIAGHLEKLPEFEIVASCANAIDASRILAAESVDLLFLDIEMPALKGTDFYRGLVRPPRVIFTTAYRDYALDGFDLEAVDYLLKPITFPRFFRAVERFLATQPRAEPGRAATPAALTALFVRVDRKDIRIPCADILFVKGLKDYARIHTADRVYTTKETMGSLGDRLGPDFVRVHRSYIVNRQRVTAVTRHDVELADVEVPVGEAYREAALLQLGG
ncbi:MAG: response regulator transcription factor [Pseudomonadota bacterium]